MLGYIVIIISTLLLYFYVSQVKKFSYWRKKNVMCIEPDLLIGNLRPLVLKQKSIGEFLRDIYLFNSNEQYVGIYFGGNPCLLVRDYEICKRILKEDKAYFTRRILQFDEQNDPLMYNTLFNLAGDQWSVVRKGVTPGLTSSRLKLYLNKMMPIVDDMHLFVEKDRNQVNVTQMLWSFTVDSITRALLGFSGKALQDPNDDMLRISKQLYGTDIISTIARVLLFAAPQIYHSLKLHAFPLQGSKPLERLTWELVRLRDEKNIEEKDLMGQLMAMRKGVKENSNNTSIVNWDGFGLSGQVMALMLAGTDTSSSVMVFLMYELARHPDVQDKLRVEVNETFPDGVSPDYDKLMSMKYLTMVVTETLRLHPSFPFVDRLCTSDYQIPGTKIKIDRGVFVCVPMWGLQMDPTHWENPTEFRPERFSDPEIFNSKPYLPFSYGPRTCIGMRFAMLQMRLILACLVQTWSWRLPEGTPPLKLSAVTFTNQLQDDLFLEFHAV